MQRSGPVLLADPALVRGYTNLVHFSSNLVEPLRKHTRSAGHAACDGRLLGSARLAQGLELRQQRRAQLGAGHGDKGDLAAEPGGEVGPALAVLPLEALGPGAVEDRPQ